MSRRDQTMVCFLSKKAYITPAHLLIRADILLLRFPRPRLGGPESRARLRPHTEPDAPRHSGHLVLITARPHIHTLHAGDIPD